MIKVLERARRYAAKCPPSISGQGGHDRAFHLAARLWNGFGLSELDTLTILREWNRRCEPLWSEADLLHKVKSVAGAKHREARGYLAGAGRAANGANQNLERRAAKTPPHEKPAFCPMVLKRVAANTRSISDIEAFVVGRSPVFVKSQDSASVLRLLYPKSSGEKVLIFSDMNSQGQLLWEAARSERIQRWHLPMGTEGVWFLPQPVDGKFHPNPRVGGKWSRRSEESVISWRYLLLESDEANPDEWLRCLVQMPLRIASICDSGRRSLHSLVRFDAASKADWDAKARIIQPMLVTLGADPRALSAVRLTRLPQAQRGERLQRLLYLNPSPDVAPILSQQNTCKGVP